MFGKKNPTVCVTMKTCLKVNMCCVSDLMTAAGCLMCQPAALLEGRADSNIQIQAMKQV